MYTFLMILIIVVAFLLVLVVLVQNSKGGGLSANFTSTGQSMGVRKTADFLEKATWTLAISLLVLSLAATAAIPRRVTEQRSLLEDQIDNVVDPNQIPSLPDVFPQEEEQQPAQQGGEGETQE